MKRRRLISAITIVLALFIGTVAAFAATVEYPVISISGIHKIKGAENLTSVNNTFILTAKDGAPLPGGENGGSIEITAPANSAFDFGKIQVSKPGTYEYTVTRKTEPSKELMQDRSVYHVHLSVFTDGKSVMVLEREGSETKPEKIEYIDRITSPEKTREKDNVQTGDTMQLYIAGGAFAFALSALLMLNHKREA